MADDNLRINTPQEDDTFAEDINEYVKKTPEGELDQGESEPGGDTPDPESDDDLLEAEHRIGHQPEEDLENPKPLNIAKDVEEAEKERRLPESASES